MRITFPDMGPKKPEEKPQAPKPEEKKKKKGSK